MHFCAHAGQFRLSLLEDSIRDGQGRVFPTSESEPGCPLRRRGRTALGGHPLSAGQVSASRGAVSPIGVDGARRRRSVAGRIRGGGWSHFPDPRAGERISSPGAAWGREREAERACAKGRLARTTGACECRYPRG